MIIHIEDITAGLDQAVLIYIIDRLLNGAPQKDLEGEYDIMIVKEEKEQELNIKLYGQNKSS